MSTLFLWTRYTATPKLLRRSCHDYQRQASLFPAYWIPMLSYQILLCLWRGEAFLLLSPLLCLSKSQPKEDQLAESSSLKQGNRLQKWMWAALLIYFFISQFLSLSLFFSLDVIITTLPIRFFSVEQPKWSGAFVKSGSHRHSRLVRVKWDGMSFQLHRDMLVIKA